jgi:WD40 repeat protein
VCVFREHDDEVRCLAFLGRLHAGERGDDRVIRIWTGLKTAQPQAARGCRDGTRKPWEALALSPDGKRLACPGGGARCASGEVETGRLSRPPRAGVLRAVAWSPDGRRVAAGGENTPVHLWEIDGNAHRQLEAVRVVASLAFSADGKPWPRRQRSRGDVWLWDVETGEPWLLIPDADDTGAIEAVAFHPTRRLVAAAGVDHLATGGSDGAPSPSGTWTLAAK